MGDSLPMKLKINLQELSIIVIATKFWESPLIKEMRREIFKKNGVTGVDSYDVRHIGRQVMKQIHRIHHLPEKVLDEIECVVRLIGEKIVLWTLRVNVGLGLELKHAENISWTCYGTVDEAKTCQLYWQNDPGLLEKADADFEKSIYSIACIFGQKEFVSKNFIAMKKMLKDFCEPKLKIPSSIDQYCLMRTWICCYFERYKNETFLLCGKSDSQPDNEDYKSIFLCATSGFLNAFKYFADNLKNDRNEYFYLTAVETVKIVMEQDQNRSMNDNYIEIIIYLIKNMSLAGRNLFLTEKLHDLFSILKEAWPYQDLLLEMVNHTVPFMQEDDYEQLLVSIIHYFCFKSSKYQPPAISNIMHQVLQKMLDVTSNRLKREIILDEKQEMFRHSIWASDIPTLKIFLNDPYLMNYREKIFELGDADRYLKSWVYAAEFDELTEFTREVFTEDENKRIKNNFIIIFKKLVEEEDFELADALVDWLADSDEEKILLRRKINPLEILASFHKLGKFCLSTWANLFNWQFLGDEEQIKVAKVSFRTDEFIRKRFYKIWCGCCISSVEAAKVRCSEFMNFFFESDEIEIFKKDKIIENENFIELFCNTLLFPKGFESIDDLLKFCGVSLEHVMEIKRKLLDNIEHWIGIFGVPDRFS